MYKDNNNNKNNNNNNDNSNNNNSSNNNSNNDNNNNSNNFNSNMKLVLPRRTCTFSVCASRNLTPMIWIRRPSKSSDPSLSLVPNDSVIVLFTRLDPKIKIAKP